MNKIKPRLIRGFKDYLPKELLPKKALLNLIIEIYERYGFSPLETPALEYKEVLLGYGSEAEKQIYQFEDPEGNEVGLRFDLTVPLSRVIAMYKDLPKPFKRYQIQPVWRYDKPDPGRFREFIQCDIDIIGSASMDADTEILAVMYEILSRLELNFKIRINNRKILNAIVIAANISEDKTLDVFRTIDKLDKVGLKGVVQLLGKGRKDQSGAFIPGIGLNQIQIQKITEFIRYEGNNREEVLQFLEKSLQGVSIGLEGIEELRQIHKNLEALGIKEHVVIDPSLARGLDYYTGPIFEAVLIDAPRFGSVMGGGRYDHLIEIFTGEHTPATGASIGIDRLLAALAYLKKIETRNSVADVLITVMVPEKKIEYFKIATQLRNAGIKTTLYMGKSVSISKQLKYADRLGIPIAVIIGPDEFEKNQITIKDLRKGAVLSTIIKERKEWLEKKPGQITVAKEEFVERIKELVKNQDGKL